MITTPSGRTFTTCVFDLDETLYPAAAGVMPVVGERIQRYMIERLHFSPSEVEALRCSYFARYGTALRGLQLEYADRIDAEDYLAYVHDLDLAALVQPAPDLHVVLKSMPLDKVIFTNATREHAERVLALLGVRENFTQIVDLRSIDYCCKPDAHAYARLLEIIGQPATACIFAEDAPRNLQPAGALGMLTVLVDPRGEPCDDFDFCVKSIVEIGNVVQGLRAGWPLPQARQAPQEAGRAG